MHTMLTWNVHPEHCLWLESAVSVKTLLVEKWIVMKQTHINMIMRGIFEGETNKK